MLQARYLCLRVLNLTANGWTMLVCKTLLIARALGQKERYGRMQDTFARACTRPKGWTAARPSARDDRVSCILTNNLNNRTRYRTGICIITGHIGLNKHLHRINRSDTPNCPNCIDTEETVAHYIGQCPAYSRMRGDTLGTYYDSINDIMDNNLHTNNPLSNTKC